MKRLSPLVGALSLAACSLGGDLAAQLKTKAASDLSCAPDDVRLEGSVMSADLIGARGRGKLIWYAYDGRDWISPADRAAFELSCSKEQLTWTKVDKTTVGVEGCGKKGVYVLVNAYRSGAKWVLNSTER